MSQGILGPFDFSGSSQATIEQLLRSIDDKLAGGDVEVVAPVLSNGLVVNIIHGDDYTVANARALEWSAPEGGWPTLLGAAIKFTVSSREDGHTLLDAVGEVVNADHVRVQLTGNQTGSLPEPTSRSGRSTCRFALKATLTDSAVVTLTRGTVLLWA